MLLGDGENSWHEHKKRPGLFHQEIKLWVPADLPPAGDPSVKVTSDPRALPCPSSAASALTFLWQK